ncbi:Beta-galactosidase, partial [Papilio machaon]
DEFVLDGKPLRIISGSLHYFRLPAAYWRDRLRKLKAAGLNSVSTYVEWSYHEPEEGQYIFEGDRDVARFVQIAAEEGLHVLLRPGPYICAERDLGGLPYWLLGKYPNIRLRTVDKDFIRETEVWMAKLFTYLKPLLLGNGGPIILVQVENEYGSYGRDKKYMGAVRDILLKHVGDKALLYTTDGTDPSMFLSGSIDGAVPTIDFGSYSDVGRAKRTFRRYFPHGPLMNSEYYSGWLTHWNESLQQISGRHLVETLRVLLDNQFNVNFYMFFGGSNFEFTSGANYDRSYLPDITSYDYDAPLTEAGDPTEKYYLIRDTLATSYSDVGRVKRTFRRYFPHGPLMNSEYYSGWLTHWNESLQQISGRHLVETLRVLLDNQFNVNFYMFFGGSNFEFTSGANYDRSYLPDITSYDYDAPLTEAGDPTEKYYLIRDTLATYYSEVKSIPLPVISKKAAYGEVILQPKGSILSTNGRSHLGKKYNEVRGSTLPTFESLRQRAGLLLYETIVNDTSGELIIAKPRDTVYVYVDKELQGVLYRNCKQTTVNLKSKPGSTLSLLVENQGRINYGNRLHDYKGILSPVQYNGKVLDGKWSVTGYPLHFVGLHSFKTDEIDPKEGPVVFETFFHIPSHMKLLDTYLDTTGWGKGYVWINGNNLGRYWPGVGPQVTLYVPGVWLRTGDNTISVLELEDVPKQTTMQFIDTPVLNRRGYMCKLP